MIPIWQQYFEGAHSLLYVVNIKEAETAANSVAELQQALAHPQMQVSACVTNMKPPDATHRCHPALCLGSRLAQLLQQNAGNCARQCQSRLGKHVAQTMITITNLIYGNGIV